MTDWREDDEMVELYQADWCKEHLTWYSVKCPFCEDLDLDRQSNDE